MPIVGTIDLHANLSPAMVQATTALVAYRTNPHLDQKARGIEAARLLAATLADRIRPVQAASFPPLAIAIDRQETDQDPCRSMFLEAEKQRQLPGVLSNSVVLGFPYADVPEMGASTLVVTDGDLELAQRLSGELAQRMWQARELCVTAGISIERAVRDARSLTGPVCLLDMGDNVGGGSAADGTLLAQALTAGGVTPAFVCLWDPMAVRTASAAGVGRRARLEMGGRTNAAYGTPLQAEATVVGLYSGRFRETKPRHGGAAEMDQGTTAVVRTDQGLTVMLTSHRMPPFSLEQLRAHDVEPCEFQAIVAKGVNAPLAAYGPVCRHFIRVATPGATAADVTSFPYTKRRRPMFPFERDGDYVPARNRQNSRPGREYPGHT
jgi:microcystin degradation protein MlrC